MSSISPESGLLLEGPVWVEPGNNFSTSQHIAVDDLVRQHINERVEIFIKEPNLGPNATKEENETYELVKEITHRARQHVSQAGRFNLNILGHSVAKSGLHMGTPLLNEGENLAMESDAEITRNAKIRLTRALMAEGEALSHKNFQDVLEYLEIILGNLDDEMLFILTNARDSNGRSAARKDRFNRDDWEEQIPDSEDSGMDGMSEGSGIDQMSELSSLDEEREAMLAFGVTNEGLEAMHAFRAMNEERTVMDAFGAMNIEEITAVSADNMDVAN